MAGTMGRLGQMVSRLMRSPRGRLTPRYTYGTGTEGLPSLLLSDYHYISHPGTDDGRQSSYFSMDIALPEFGELLGIPEVTLKRVINILKSNSPTAAQSLANFRQMLTYGYDIEGRPKAKANIQRILAMLAKRRKPLSLLLGQMADGIYCGGGLYTEVVLDEQGEDTIDFAVNDPLNAKFRYHEDKLYGGIFELVSVDHRYRIKSLEAYETIQYLPLNGDVNSPFGKPYLLAGIYPALWQFILLRDVRSLLHSQLYPFVHVKVDLEKILDSVGNDLKEAEELAIKSRNAAIESWKKKGTNTAIGTGDEVSYEIISGLNRQNSGFIDPLLRVLGREMSSGFLTMPVFLGQNEGTTETHSDTQWLIQVAFLRSVLREVEDSVTESLNIMNRAGGIRGEVYLDMWEMDIMERLREAKVFETEEDAMLKLLDRVTKERAQNIIKTDEEMITVYEERRDRIYAMAA